MFKMRSSSMQLALNINILKDKDNLSLSFFLHKKK